MKKMKQKSTKNYLDNEKNETVTKKQNKEKMMTLLDAMKHMQTLAELLTSHPYQIVMLGGINRLIETVRTGKSHSEEKFFSREMSIFRSLVTAAQMNVFALPRALTFHI